MKTFWNHNKIAYGGDYNPEQWPREVWLDDMEKFKKAHIDIVTLNVFSWASLQKDDDIYDFERLDEIIDLATENNLKICLATSTGAHPAWMARKYPEILRVDNQGRKHKFGGRHNSCPNSPVYRKFAARLAGKLAERYGKRDNVIAWHISNEFGGDCYCENCEKAFREWLKNRYGNMDELNRAWNTAFWSHTFYDWEEIVLPSHLSEHFDMMGRDYTQFQSITLDYKRFNSDSMLKCFEIERDAIRAVDETTPVTTNLMAFYPLLDYQKWAKSMDFVSWDNYPSPGDSPARKALNHALIRGMKDNNPFCLMEQTPSVTNWQPYNKLKRPGEMRLISYQAVAQGADTVMFFQMRRSIGACEKYHGAVIDHAGRDDTRMFREITALGEELDAIGDRTLGSRTDSKVAIVFDWENWWAISGSAGPSILINYHEEVLRYYEALHQLNISCDIVPVDSKLDNYKLVIAPIAYMIKKGYAEKLDAFVKNGGNLVTTYFSGYVDESDLVQGAYPGKLSELLGIWVEESDALPNGENNTFKYKGNVYKASILCDIIRPQGAQVISTYEEDFYAGEPVITENIWGAGKAYYVGCSSDAEFYKEFIRNISSELDIRGIMKEMPLVEVTRRVNKDGAYIFILNHDSEDKDIVIEHNGTDLISGITVREGEHVLLKARDVMIIHAEA